MNLDVITEEDAMGILTECLRKKSEPAFVKYIEANCKAASDAFETYGTLPHYHAILTRICEECGIHSYLIINKIAKKYYVPW